jgi:hypothetical protein
MKTLTDAIARPLAAPVSDLLASKNCYRIFHAALSHVSCNMCFHLTVIFIHFMFYHRRQADVLR